MDSKKYYGQAPFERIGGANSLVTRLEILDRLTKGKCPLIVWQADKQYYRVFWKKIGRQNQKWVKVCSKSGRTISTNIRGVTEASLDVHLKVLFDTFFGVGMKALY